MPQYKPSARFTILPSVTADDDFSAKYTKNEHVIKIMKLMYQHVINSWMCERTNITKRPII